MKTPTVSIVVPVHNEELILDAFIKSLVSACKKLKISYELLLIENGSKDLTWQIIEKNMKRSSTVYGLRLKKADYGAAMIAGIKKSRGKYVVIFNVDYWDRKFLSITRADLLGYDIVIGSKRLPGSLDQRQLTRRLTTWAFNWFLKIFLGYPGTDTHGIKVFNKEKLMPVIQKCKTRSGIVDSEIMVRAYRQNLQVLELPTTVREVRPAVFGLKRIWQTPLDVLRLYQVLKS